MKKIKIETFASMTSISTNNDIRNSIEVLERSLRRIGITLHDEMGNIKHGKVPQCLQLLRKLLFYTSPIVAKQVLLKGCTSLSADKKILLVSFELIRENLKIFPSISTEQFMGEVLYSIVL